MNKISLLMILGLCITACLYSCDEGTINEEEVSEFLDEVIIDDEVDFTKPQSAWRASMEITDITMDVGEVGVVELKLMNTMKEADKSVEATVYIKQLSPKLELVTNTPFPRTVLVGENYNGIPHSFGVKAKEAGVYECRIVFRSLPKASKTFYVAKGFTITVK